MSRYRCKQLLLLSFLLCYAAPVFSAEFWSKKPYQDWSVDEAQRLLEESPWATTLTLGGIRSVASSMGVPSARSSEGEMETDPTISYTLQFRSALPVREAQVRSMQFGAHYDKMTKEQRKAFDDSAARFLAVTFPDKIIVAVTFHTNVGDYESQLRNYWASQSLAKLSMTAYLNTKSDRLSLIAYSFKDDTFQFTFPRPKQIDLGDKISVEFIHPRIMAVGEQRVLQEFKVKKMLVNGAPSI